MEAIAQHVNKTRRIEEEKYALETLTNVRTWPGLVC